MYFLKVTIVYKCLSLITINYKITSKEKSFFNYINKPTRADMPKNQQTTSII